MSDTSNLRELDTPAHTELHNMLRGSLYVDDAPQAVAAHLAEMCTRFGTGFVVTVHRDGCGSIVLGENYFGGLFKPLADAFAEAEAWLARDVVGDVNVTLGLTAEGRLPPKLAVAERDPRDPDPTKDGIFRDHRCARCADGSRLDRCPTPNRPGNCGYPQARND